ncbi:zinc finger protein, putative [Plasmodium sp. gorilla clade G2]|uniref:zinc finger protein, putative n=1 Tax=Plasmodium sp. gorilla clade G2 TaxID=880535 RepID=UPI000D20E504|nr:zinc finger protein, putative [Plasmodium sp. gorilla clade G2]SOV11773.1 zinc finger protein, putative [Plasmodium sp. gorilla clade G2]
MSESSALSTSVKDTNKCDSSNYDKEELIDINKSFINIEDENTKDIKNYMNDKTSFMKRIQTFKAWVRKPAHLSSLILARNGYVCQDEFVIRCEICNCKYIYEKDTYSMYTRINDLCLLHLDNCPWKNILMDLSIFDLDYKSLRKEELLREYEDNIVSLRNNLLYVPFINIKKALNDLIYILKKYLENNMNKKRFSIFDHYVKIFKEQYIEIFLNNKNIIDKGIEIIRNKYPLYEKYIVDINYLNNLNFNINNITTFINILSDICLDDSFCDEQDDINMYFKIIQKLKNYQYENINIFKLMALFGWSYKSHDEEHAQILQCKYCFREIDIVQYSYFSLKENKLFLHKDLFASQQKDVLQHILKRKNILLEQRRKQNEKDTLEFTSEHIILSKMCDDLRETYHKCIELMRDNKKKEHEQNQEKGNNDLNKEENMDKNNNIEENNKNEKCNPSDVASQSDSCQENVEYSQSDGITNSESNIENSQKEQEGFSFKWKLKNLFSSQIVQQGVKDIYSDKLSCEEDREHILEDMKEIIFSHKMENNKDHTKNNNNNSNNSNNSNDGDNNNSNNSNDDDNNVENHLKECIGEMCLNIGPYLENQNYFIKSLYDYYVLLTPEISSTDKNETDIKNAFIIRPFNVVENHRIYCPYITEDLYLFSKITKLIFELLILEFERKYVFK